MSKKSGAQGQLSPENYIRQRARTLQLHECRINNLWKEQGLANILIARKHSSGTITMCSYLVDLYCLGVKDSFFGFNQPEYEYLSLIERYNENGDYTVIDYALAHNIILAAVEYAEELGFMPCKMYQQTTRWMLEEDNDDVELIEIECGKDGKPMLALNGSENPAHVLKMLERLKSKVGEGNFSYIYEGEYIDDHHHRNFTEDENRFLNLHNQYPVFSDEELEEFKTLLQGFIDTMGEQKFYDAADNYYLPLKKVKLTNRMENPLLMGLSVADELPDKDAVKAFGEFLYAAVGYKPVATQKLNRLKQLLPGHPASLLAEVFFKPRVDPGPSFFDAQQLLNQYTEYPLLRMWTDNRAFIAEKDLLMWDEDPLAWLDKYYSGHEPQKEIHEIEMFLFLLLLLHQAFDNDELEYIVSLTTFADKLDLNTELKEYLNVSAFDYLLIIVRNWIEEN